MDAHDPSSPGEYYAAVSPQSPSLIGAEGGLPASAAPAGVLRKQGQSYLCYFVTHYMVAAWWNYVLRHHSRGKLHTSSKQKESTPSWSFSSSVGISVWYNK